MSKMRQLVKIESSWSYKFTIINKILLKKRENGRQVNTLLYITS